mgnify:CR=1 FL=1
MKSRAILLRTFIFALLWLALTGGAESAWIYGAVVAVAAGALSLGLYPADRQGVQIWRAALFAPTLLARGFLGGLDVASTRACRSSRAGSGSASATGTMRPMLYWAGSSASCPEHCRQVRRMARWMSTCSTPAASIWRNWQPRSAVS